MTTENRAYNVSKHTALSVRLAVASAMRLALLSSGVDHREVYDDPDAYGPQDDEARLLETIEEARNAWKVRRSWSDG